jgi:hypothetical protein
MDCCNENVKQKFGVFWTSHVLGMKLNAKIRQSFVYDSLVGLVVLVVEERVPVNC